VSRDESILSPTFLALQMRRQWSDEHVFDPSPLHPRCERCGMDWKHPNHCTREQDRAITVAMADRIRAARGE
jgi:hypothetical protein